MTSTEPTTCGFEGPEKRLYASFIGTAGEGLRSISDERWAVLLQDVKCEVLNVTRTEYCTAFVLSESSLFVWSHSLVLKTCGTTTLLCCLAQLLEVARELCGLELLSLQYSRKNFLFPHKQVYPHISIDDEWEYLKNFVPDGEGYTFGAREFDQWYVFYASRDAELLDKMTVVEDASCLTGSFPSSAESITSPNSVGTDTSDSDVDNEDALSSSDSCPSPATFLAASKLGTALPFGAVVPALEADARPTVEIMMHDVPEDVCRQFYNEDGTKKSCDVTASSGIASLVQSKDQIIDDYIFEPCGYSMNGLLTDCDGYWTIHITPESHCSYVSFEFALLAPGSRANSHVSEYQAIVSRVLGLFRPGRFTIAYYAGHDSHVLSDDPATHERVDKTAPWMFASHKDNAQSFTEGIGNDGKHHIRHRNLMELANYGKVVMVESGETPESLPLTRRSSSFSLKSGALTRADSRQRLLRMSRLQ